MCNWNGLVWGIRTLAINISTEGLKWQPMLWQSQESTFRKMVYVCVPSHWNTNDSAFWLASMMLYVIISCDFPHFVGPNLISHGPTNEMSIHSLGLFQIIMKIEPVPNITIPNTWSIIYMKNLQMYDSENLKITAWFEHCKIWKCLLKQ